MWASLIILGLWLMAPRVVAAVDLQYVLATGQVTGASDEALPSLPGYGLVTLQGQASEIVWPVPVGCTSGQSGWTRITDPEAVTLAGGGMTLIQGLIIFASTSSLLTTCEAVGTWEVLHDLVERTIIEAVAKQPMIGAFNQLNVVTHLAVCPPAVVSTACSNARTRMADLTATATVYPSASTLNTFLGQIQQLRDDAIALKQAQMALGTPGW